MKILSLRTACIIFLSLVFRVGYGQNEPEIFQVDGIAIAGFDPVAFFVEEMPRKADGVISYSWKGAEWWFTSEDNKELFQENPSKYIPQFGGYCAWGMREGYKADTNPKKAWTLFDGKLYLNYDKGTMKGWLPEKEESIRIASDNWSKMTHQ